MDAGYFTKAFAASPEAVVPGYVIGGICYFSIPWALGTVMGMTALGLETSKSFPTFPRVNIYLRCLTLDSPFTRLTIYSK